jgi:hypothetical protein
MSCLYALFRWKSALWAAVLTTTLSILAPVPCYAVTLRDLVELSRAGLGEDVLIALIDADGGKFTLTAAELLELRQEGLSDRVLVALLRSGRENVPSAVSAAQSEIGSHEVAPRVVVIGKRPEPPPPPPPQSTIVVGLPLFGPIVPVHETPARATHRSTPIRPGLLGRVVRDGFSNFEDTTAPTSPKQPVGHCSTTRSPK